MLKSLDILIGLSAVMLVLSMAVTLMTQALLTFFASRGRYLREGLSDLLVMLDAGLTRADTDEIAARILSHPLINCTFGFPGWLIRLVPGLRYGEVIHREEFVKVLLLFGDHYAEAAAAFAALRAAIGQGGAPDSAAVARLAAVLKQFNLTSEYGQIDDAKAVQRVGDILQKLGDTAANPDSRRQLLAELKSLLDQLYGVFGKLGETLKANGIDDPGKVLKAVRTRALELEKSSPELANDIRDSKALLENASSEFLAKVHMNFDQFMDRVGARFTANARAVTFFSAAALAVALQLDAVALVNRLAMDDQMRAAFVEQAAALAQDQQVNSIAQPAPPKPPAAAQAGQDKAAAPAPTSAADDSNDPGQPNGGDPKGAVETEKYYLRFLAEQGVISFPVGGKWCRNWERVSLPGIFVSILLLSLGAPFWYNALSGLLQLRSAVAQKDQDQRAIRQTTQETGGASGLNGGGNSSGVG